MSQDPQDFDLHFDFDISQILKPQQEQEQVTIEQLEKGVAELKQQALSIRDCLNAHQKRLETLELDLPIQTRLRKSTDDIRKLM